MAWDWPVDGIRPKRHLFSPLPGVTRSCALAKALPTGSMESRLRLLWMEWTGRRSAAVTTAAAGDSLVPLRPLPRDDRVAGRCAAAHSKGSRTGMVLALVSRGLDKPADWRYLR